MRRIRHRERMQITDRVHPLVRTDTRDIGPGRRGEQRDRYKKEPFVPHSSSRFLLPTRSRGEGRALLGVGSQERGDVPAPGQRQGRVTPLRGGRR